ncbi:MAG: hypothetical protein II820_10875 [Ruminiclostridium sp.]|nr:hypothetical protein [Ruminiclostridium sp.]
MKKIISLISAFAAAGAFTFSASADLFVTISDDNGKLVLAQQPVDYADKDGDGVVTVNDALISAHDKYYDGGSKAGYGSAEGDHCLMITKLWGIENGGSCGCYINIYSAMSLADPLIDGDKITAFVYTDNESHSDTFCYFNGFADQAAIMVVAAPGTPFELKLLSSLLNDKGAPITVPVAGAEITLNGEKTGIITDDDGKAEIAFPENEGSYIVSAVSDTMTLVPPVAMIETELPEQDIPVAVDDAVIDEPEEAAAPAAGDVTAATDSTKGSPDTGIADIAVVSGIAALAAGALILTKKRK